MLFLIHPHLCSSINPSLHPSLHPSIHPSTPPSIHPPSDSRGLCGMQERQGWTLLCRRVPRDVGVTIIILLLLIIKRIIITISIIIIIINLFFKIIIIIAPTTHHTGSIPTAAASASTATPCARGVVTDHPTRWGLRRAARTVVWSSWTPPTPSLSTASPPKTTVLLHTTSSVTRCCFTGRMLQCNVSCRGFAYLLYLLHLNNSIPPPPTTPPPPPPPPFRHH